MKDVQRQGMTDAVAVLVLCAIVLFLAIGVHDGDALGWVRDRGDRGAVDSSASKREALEDAQPSAPQRENVSSRPLYPISVIVRDRSSGTPIPVAHVAASADAFDSVSYQMGARTDLVESMTDGLGKVLLDMPADGIYDVMVTHDHYGRRIVEGCFVGGEVVVELEELEAAGLVFGRVTWKGQAVDGAELTIRPRAGALMRNRTDASGNFWIPGVPSGRITISVFTDVAARYISRRRLDPEGRLEIEIVLQPGVILDGFIEDAETGLPVPSAEVACGWTFEDSVLTDKEGHFLIENVRSNSHSFYQLFVRAPGYAQACRDVTLPPPSDITIALSRGHKVSGRIVGEPGTAILSSVRMALVAMRTEASGGTNDISRTARCGQDGHFEFQNVGSGSHTLLIYTPIGGLSFMLPPLESDLDLGSIEIGRRNVIAGHVRDDGGEPVAGVEVYLEGWARGLYRFCAGGTGPGDIPERVRFKARSDRAGLFRFPAVLDGEYDIVVRMGGFLQEHVQVRGQDISGFEIRIPSPARIVGSVVTDLDVNLGECQVAAQSVDGHLTTAGVRIDGSFELRGLKRGDVYRILGLRAPTSTAFVPLEGVPANAHGVRLVLGKASTVHGRVHDEDGVPVRTSIWRRIGDGPGISTAESDPSGHFVLYVEPSFVGEIWAQVDASGEKSEARLVTAGDREVTLRMQ